MRLDKIPAKDRRNDDVVLNQCRLLGMLTIWEITDKQEVASTVVRLERTGRLVLKPLEFPRLQVVEVDGEQMSPDATNRKDGDAQ